MPYSIQTKDGIKINNIPDDIDPSSDILKQRVAAIRQGNTQAQPNQAAPTIQNQNIQPEQQLQNLALFGRVGYMPEAETVRGVVGAAKELATGELRSTPATRDLPEIGTSGILSGLDGEGKKALIAQALVSATKPDEIVQILTSSFPDQIKVQYDKDDTGRVYPLLVNRETGARAVINKPGISGIDIVQGLGLASIFTPSGAASSPLRVGIAAGATEAALQGTQAAVGGEFNPEEVALSAGLGVGGKVLGDLVSASKAAPVASDLVEEGEKAGVKIMTSDVLPPKTFFGKHLQQTMEKIPLLGTGGMRAEQQSMREAAVNQIIDDYKEFSYDAVVKNLRTQKDKVKSAAGNVMNSVGSRLDDLGEIPLTNTKKAIQDALEKLDKPGTIKPQKAIDELNSLRSTLDEAPQSFTMLKQTRTDFREIANSVDPAERSQLRSRGKALLEEVERSMGRDMEQLAKNNLSSREFIQWKKANAIYASEAQKLRRSKLKSILDSGDVTPERVKTMLFSTSPSEIRLLNSSLSEAGKKHVRAAVISKVVDDLSKRAGQGITPNAFVGQMNKYQNQIDILFTKTEKKRLKGLMRVLDATRRAQDASVTTPTGQVLFGGALAGGAITDPTATIALAGTLGGLSRLYESPAVRNALLKVGSSPLGSIRFDQALSEAQKALLATAQQIRSQTESQRE